MSASLLAIDRVRALLPDEWKLKVSSGRLEMTPHRAFRFLLLDKSGQPAAVAHLDEAAEQCVPPLPETLSGSLRELLPRPLYQGALDGRPLCIRSYTDGATLDSELASGRTEELLDEAQSLLAKIQAERRSHRVFDEMEFERFVSRPAAWIRECARFTSEGDAKLQPLIDAARVLLGKELDYALHHGDFQFSNLLRGSDGSMQIIDWELSQGEAPVWMDRVHLAIAHISARRQCSYGAASRELRVALQSDATLLPYHFAEEAMSLDESVRRGSFVLCVLHGMSNFLRRVPHLADQDRIDDFLSAGDAFLKL